MNDQEVIRQRVLQEDRKLRSLYKRFLALAPASSSSSSRQDELDAAQSLFLLDVQHVGLSLSKGKQAILDDATQREVGIYRTEIEQINRDQVATRAEIERLRANLAEAQRIRTNFIEYDRLAKEINKIPARDTSNEHIGRLHQDIRDLESQESRYTETWALRKAAFDEIVTSIEQMGERVREEQNEQERRRALDEDAQEGEGGAVEGGEADRSTADATAQAPTGATPGSSVDTPSAQPLDPTVAAFKPAASLRAQTMEGGDVVMEDGEV